MTGSPTHISLILGLTLYPQRCSTGCCELFFSHETRDLSCLLISEMPEVGDEVTPPLSLVASDVLGELLSAGWKGVALGTTD